MAADWSSSFVLGGSRVIKKAWQPRINQMHADSNAVFRRLAQIAEPGA
jgi:hypothetical protein